VPDVVILFVPERSPSVQQEARDGNDSCEEQEAGEKCKVFHKGSALMIRLFESGDELDKNDSAESPN
jgi:hypothetical protein